MENIEDKIWALIERIEDLERRVDFNESHANGEIHGIRVAQLALNDKLNSMQPAAESAIATSMIAASEYPPSRNACDVKLIEEFFTHIIFKRKINAINSIRSITGISLKEGKMFVEKIDNLLLIFCLHMTGSRNTTDQDVP